MNNNLLTIKLLLLTMVISSLFVSCKEDYFYEENLPPGLGKSIYDELKNNGSYNYYVRLIDDLEYTDVLSKTGSKTLFVADDKTFDLFFENGNNTFGVTKYEDFSTAQKRIILNSSMLNNAILVEKLSTVEGPVSGQAIRRATAVSSTDTIGWEPVDKLPVDNVYWDRFRNSGIRLLKDNTPIPMFFFTEEQMSSKGITENDFLLITGKEHKKDTAYVYGIKVKERDITCQNGYIHVLEEVLVPPSNMADVLLNAPEATVFSSFLERFSAPYGSDLTDDDGDSIFVKGYFAERSNIVPKETVNDMIVYKDPNGNSVADVLLFDPGWNRYFASEITGSFQTDMGVIFAPSDAAMETFFQNGVGRTLINRYGEKENIPNEVLSKLLRNHMKASFLSSLPSQFHNIMNDAQESMGVIESDIDKTYLASNGAVYIMNKVYPPAIFSSVMFPAVINENMKVFYWAINNLDFNPYLLSMVNQYAFFLPQDGFTYIVPTSLGKVRPVAWKFHYDNDRNSVYASVHLYDATNNEIGDSISVVRTADYLKNHLEDMLDYHIVVIDSEAIEDDSKEYYRTKGGGTIRIKRNGNELTEVAGGGDIDRETLVSIEKMEDMSNGGNGKTYILNEPVQSPVRSVYKVFEETPQFSKFFELLKGNDALWGDETRRTKYTIFYTDTQNAGLDYNVRFLNTYHYTLYVPTDDAVQEAYNNGLPTWDDVANESDQTKRDSIAEKIIRFVRYHFQDNAVFLEKNITETKVTYETATLNNNTDTFYQLNLTLNANYSLDITTASGGNTTVETSNGLYNIMARDFKFDTSTPLSANKIETSSYIVLHQINKCLYFE